MRSLAEGTFIVTDVETTGISPEKHRITEVACVTVRGGEIIEERQSLVNPERAIPLAIQRMTGITNAMVFAAPKGGEIFPDIRTWFPDDAVFVAHNVMFDFNFLQHSFLRHGVSPMGHPKLCTARLARRILPPQKSWALQHLTAYFGIRIRGRHRAMGDAHATARALVELLDILQEDFACETLDDVLTIQYRTMGALGRELPKHIRNLEPVLGAIPAVPGVYRMLDTRGEVLYIGKAKNLRDRVGSYFRHGAAHTKKIAEMVRRVRKVEVEETGSELGALLLESRLIKEHQPKYNTLQKRYRRYAFLRIDHSELFPRVGLALEIEPDGAEYFGPFRNRGAVQSMIETINQVFGLRECEGPIIPSLSAVPCLYHQIRRCGAPCAGLQSPEEYITEVDRVRSFLSGAESGIINILEERMQACAERLEFESAAEIRDRINELRRIFLREERIADSVNCNNVIILLPAAERGKREIFLIRFGRLVGQVVIGAGFPEAKFRRLVEKHYFDGAVAPAQCRKEEIDEIRIIASYLHLHRDTGKFVYVEPGDDVNDVVRNFRKFVRKEDEAGTSVEFP